jgi:TnpA family transposase
MAQWDDVLRLTASVRTGTVSASLLLKRLGAYPRQNGLALALREIGRIERTLLLWTGWNSRNFAGKPRRN